MSNPLLGYSNATLSPSVLTQYIPTLAILPTATSTAPASSMADKIWSAGSSLFNADTFHGAVNKGTEIAAGHSNMAIGALATVIGAPLAYVFRDKIPSIPKPSMPAMPNPRNWFASTPKPDPVDPVKAAAEATEKLVTHAGEQIKDAAVKGVEKVAEQSEKISQAWAKSFSDKMPAITADATKGLEKVADKFGSSFASSIVWPIIWAGTIITPLTAFIKSNADAVSRREEALLKHSLMRGNIFTATLAGLSAASLWKFVINRSEKKAVHDLEKNAVA